MSSLTKTQIRKKIWYLKKKAEQTGDFKKYHRYLKEYRDWRPEENDQPADKNTYGSGLFKYENQVLETKSSPVYEDQYTGGKKYGIKYSKDEEEDTDDEDDKDDEEDDETMYLYQGDELKEKDREAVDWLYLNTELSENDEKKIRNFREGLTAFTKRQLNQLFKIVLEEAKPALEDLRSNSDNTIYSKDLTKKELELVELFYRNSKDISKADNKIIYSFLTRNYYLNNSQMKALVKMVKKYLEQ